MLTATHLFSINADQVSSFGFYIKIKISLLKLLVNNHNILSEIPEARSVEGRVYADLNTIYLGDVERLLPEDPQLKFNKSKYKEEGNRGENIASNKLTMQSLQERNNNNNNKH